MKKNHSEFTAEDLRVGRGDLGLTMKEAADLCEVTYSSWVNWESGRRRCPAFTRTFLKYLEQYKKV